MSIKIFCDSADLKIIKKYSKSSIVKGFTTNPSLMRLSKAKNYKNYSTILLRASNQKPISFEVFADNFYQMERQAYKISSWGKNVYVKIPVINSKGSFSGSVIKKLSDQGIKLNITAIYTVAQVRKILKKVNKNSRTIISIFAGRMADAGRDPVPIIRESVKLTKKFKKIEILWASTREAYNYTQAKNLRCSIITMPPNIIQKVSKFGKSLNDLSLDTVKIFLKDSKKSQFKI